MIRPRAFRALLAAALATIMLGVSGCGAPEAGGDRAAPAADTLTVPHAFGATQIGATERVVAWGWGSADAMVAMGQVPTAMPKYTYGANPDGLMPWMADALAARGAPTPTLITEGDEPPYDEIIKARPDVILATYSGITRQQYDKLSAIAPTVAYPQTPGATPWREVITTTGTVLRKPDEARAVVADIEAELAKAAQAHPEFAGKTIAAVATDPSNTVYVYTPRDPRVEFLEDLGFSSAPSVAELYNGDVGFYYTLSTEKLDALTSDVLLQYLENPATDEAFAASPGVQTMPQVKSGAVAKIIGESLVSSVSPPTALSLRWGLQRYVDALAAAARTVPR